MYTNTKKQNKRNFVAKHAKTFNKSVVMIDRKKESKKNGDYYNESAKNSFE